MTLVALANALLARSHGRALPRRAASAGDRAAAAGARAAQRRHDRAAAARRDARRRAGRRRRRCGAIARRTPRSPHTQFLSNGNYVTSITNAGGGASTWRGLPVTRWRRDATRDADGQFVYLRDVRSGVVWSATYQPTLREPDEYAVVFSTERATFRRRDEDLSTQLDIAVSTEDDVEVRRITVRNHGTRIREIDVTSYAEIVLSPATDDLAHPAFGKLFVETEYLADSAALVCHRRPREPGEPAAWAFHALSLDGRPQGPLEWETDRARFLGRGRSPADPQALDGRALSGTTGVVLDPIVSLRQRIRLPPGAHGAALSFATGMAADRETVEALARKYHEPRAAARAFALALTHAESGLRHLGISRRRGGAVRAAGVSRARHRRVASSRRRDDRGERARSARPVAARHLRGSADPAGPRDRRRSDAAGAAGAAGAGVLAAEGSARRRRDRQRASGQLPGRDARAADGRPRTTARGAPGSIGRAAPTCCAPIAWARPSACCSKRWPARSSAATTATCARSSLVPTPGRPPVAPSRTGVPGARGSRRRPRARAADDADQRARRIHRRRTDLRDRARRRARRRRCRGST